ncbi:MAG: nucleotide exchange factor GrpE [Nitrospirota bacterium]
MEENKITEDKVNEEESEIKSFEISEISQEEKDRLIAGIKDLNDKYLRLYAEFENYKKRVNKDKQELVKYSNESLVRELLPVIDNLEMALKHPADENSRGLIQGVENTLRELLRTLEKFGLTPIEAVGKPFDPLIHHALTLYEREDVEENIVVEEFRKGYMFGDKVLRASLVAVSKGPVEIKEEEKREEEEIKNIKEDS